MDRVSCENDLRDLQEQVINSESTFKRTMRATYLASLRAPTGMDAILQNSPIERFRKLLDTGLKYWIPVTELGKNC